MRTGGGIEPNSAFEWGLVYLAGIWLDSHAFMETAMNAPDTKRLFIVDGSGYIFRAFYAVAPLTTKDGFPTNALFGFVRMLLRLLKDADSHHLVVVFDAGRETFRNQLYPQYKANRVECPPELAQQMPYFREIVSTFGIPVLEQKGFEADDIIATLSTRLEKLGHEVVIVTADRT